MSPSGFLDGLGRRSRPLFGQLTLTALLLCALALAGYFLTNFGGIHPLGEPSGNVATLLSWLPASWRNCAVLFRAFGVGFILGAALWLARRGLPWSSWACALSFLGILSLYLENASQATHVAHLTAQLLLVHALWYHFYAAEIRAADRAGRFWETPLYPRWVHALGVFAIGWFYGWSGLSKLLESGWGWANGLSLQLWANLWGDRDSLWTRFILADRRLAALLQATTLVGETAGFLAIVWPRVRPAIGLLLIGFHVGQIAVFGWGFHANMLMLGLFFLPVDRWLSSPAAKDSIRNDPGIPETPTGSVGENWQEKGPDFA